MYKRQLLGRLWCVEGEVVTGDQRGRTIGFPTCNIQLNKYILPKLGVYSVWVQISNLKKKGIANIGYRPTFNGKNLLLEVNIFGIKRNLYKKILKISFIKFIRAEKKFNNINHLKAQIKKIKTKSPLKILEKNVEILRKNGLIFILRNLKGLV